MSDITNATNQFVKRALGTVIAILSVLTVLSGTLLSVRLVDYIKVDDNEVRLTSNMDAAFDLFSVQYENGSGEITVSGADGQKVVAPGTNVEYTIRLRNADKTALDCKLIPRVRYTSDYKVPILVRMLDTEHNYIIGDEKTWVTVEEIGEISAEKTLVEGESTEYYFQWKWEFESGNDAYDTEIGNAAAKQDLVLEVNFTVEAEANTEIGSNGGVIKSGLGDIVTAGASIVLLGSALALNVVVLIKKRKSKGV